MMNAAIVCSFIAKIYIAPFRVFYTQERKCELQVRTCSGLILETWFDKARQHLSHPIPIRNS